jgi:hypothetical protein
MKYKLQELILDKERSLTFQTADYNWRVYVCEISAHITRLPVVDYSD